MKKIIRTSPLVAIAVLTSAALQAGPPVLFKYAVSSVATYDLGTLGGAQSVANDINDGGKIVGWAETTFGTQHGFYYSAGTFTDVGFWLGSATSEARGINASNTVVGTWTSGGTRHAFRWITAGILMSLNDISPAGDTLHSEAHAISDSGFIAGERVWRDTLMHVNDDATVWTDDLTFYSIESAWTMFDDAYAINASNQVVGERDAFNPRPARWQFSPAGSPTTHVPLICPGDFNNGAALGINVHGNVVGYGYCLTATDPGNRAFYWNGSSASSTNLGVLPGGHDSVATDVNDSVFISGYGDRPVPILWFTIPSDFGFIYHRDFGKYTLPKLPASSSTMDCQANALNNLKGGRVQVVGYCDTYGGRRAVRWDVSIKKVPFLPAPL